MSKKALKQFRERERERASQSEKLVPTTSKRDYSKVVMLYTI